MRVRQSRARMLSQYRRGRSAGPAHGGNRPVARVLTYDDPDEPSTSRGRPRHVNQLLLDLQRALQRRDEDLEDDFPDEEANERAFASRLIYHAQTNIYLDEGELLCQNCGMLPLMPVTGICGHTRCFKCIQQFVNCTCGAPHIPWLLNVNVVIQELVRKVLSTEEKLRQWMFTSEEPQEEKEGQPPQHLPFVPEPTGNVTPPPLQNACYNEGRFATPLKKPKDSPKAHGDRSSDKIQDKEKAVVSCDDVDDADFNKPNGCIKTVPPAEEVLVPSNDHAREEEAAGIVVRPARPIDQGEPDDQLCREPVTPEARLNYVGHLVQRGQLFEAAVHLALVACTDSVAANTARRMLVKVISELSKTRDVSELEDELREAIGVRAVGKWLSPRDLECVFCCDTLCRPVTTPCGHTFCRPCLERSLDYRSTCALCMQDLFDFNIQDVGITGMVTSTLAAIGSPQAPAPSDPNFIPILACTVAFPGLPSPLFLSQPRYWYMIRRILESDSRRFGVIANECEGGLYSNYGTILELRDCVHLRNGCTIVSTIGISRFRVVERDVTDGWCDVARVHPLVDIPITSEVTVQALRYLARKISFKAALWISCFSTELRTKIQRSCGAMPQIDVDGDWWRNPDGPVWLWWIISILPLTLEIKILILATNCLMKRMRAVLRSLDCSLCRASQSLRDYELTLADWWQQRNL